MTGTFRGNFSKKSLTKGNLAAFGTVILSIGGIAVTRPAQAVDFGEVDFPEGEISFADFVVSYDRGPDNGDYSFAPLEAFDNPETAVGIPNSVTDRDAERDGDFSQRSDVSLGEGGTLVLRFADNFLTRSGDDSEDLWVFEAGTVVEGVLVEISEDGDNFFSVGQIGGTQVGGIDIDAFDIDPEIELFSFVRLTDDGSNVYDGGWAGADIDSVGAISTIAAADIPEPSTVLGLLAIGILGAGTQLKRKG
ncbi:MAG: PEP-CTERM sorting domain-containing protein [Microcoleaceae cyanobacterium]